MSHNPTVRCRYFLPGPQLPPQPLGVEVHRLLADNQYRPIIGQFADNRYRPFDNRHQLIIGRLSSADADNRPIICFSKQNNKKMLLTAVHIVDNEITTTTTI